MNIRSLLIGVIAFVSIALATPALAMYHPGVGRFMQRDPLGTMNAPRVGSAFVTRDPMPTQPQAGMQYADGMNLYQYVGSSPTAYVDPQGLARLQYSYIGVWVTDGRVIIGKDNYHIADNKATTTFLENEVENLLWKLGVNAWRTGKFMHKDLMYTWSTKRTVFGYFSNTNYDLYDLENKSEWSYTGTDARNRYGNADDIIMFVPGYIGWDGKVVQTWGAAHLPGSHVIAVPRALYTSKPATTKAIWLAHEVLHHFLPDDWHDTEGIMHPSAENGLSDKLGCMTLEKLKEKGLTAGDVDANHLIK